MFPTKIVVASAGILSSIFSSNFEVSLTNFKGAISGQFDLNVVDIRDSYIHRYSELRLRSDTTLAPLKLVRLTSKLELNIEDKSLVRHTLYYVQLIQFYNFLLGL